MDHKSRTDILSVDSRTKAPAASLAVLAAGLFVLAGCGGSKAAPRPPDLPAVGGQVTLIRVPRDGGTVEAYDPSQLDEPVWTSRASVRAVRDVLGVNLEARLLLVVDTTDALVAVDLEARGTRPIAAGVEHAVMIPNGSAYVMNAAKQVTRFDAGTPTAYRPPLPAVPDFHYGTYNDRYVAVLADTPPTMLIGNSDRSLHKAPIAEGEIATTYWGDLVAVAGGRGVVLYDTSEPFGSEAIEVPSGARHVTFSPSGHRLYVAGESPDILVIDRFSRDPLGSIRVPGAPARLRTDASGRWLIAQPASAGSVWVVDLTTGRLAATVETEWASDLPTVAGAATLIARDGADVVASDLSRQNRPELGRLADAAGDLWIVTTWIPDDRLSEASAAAEAALIAQDSLLRRDSVTTGAPTDSLYLQVSSSQNADWSKELARQLTTAGYPARVLEPGSADEGYRVVVGPFGTREDAEETGRKLGRPYFVLTNPKFR